MEGESGRHGCRPLPIAADLGFAIPVNANPPFPSDSVKFEGDLCRIVSDFHIMILTRAECYSEYNGFEAPEHISEIVIGDPVPEREVLDIQE